MIRKAGIGIIIWLMAVRLFAQQAEAYSHIERDSIMIGDQIGLELGITLPEGFVVQWTPLADTITKNIEIVDRKEIDTVVKENALYLSQRLVITSFDSGYFKIPSYTFRFMHAGDSTVYETRTPEQFLNVYTPVVDTSQAFKIIKGPMAEPVTFREVLPWILLALAVILIASTVVWYVRKRKKNKPLFIAKPKPDLPPHVVAIKKLEELRLAKVWQQGKVKEYYTQLTDIMREYLERRYGFDAPEMTTEEIFEELASKSLSKEATEKLHSTFSLADLVKFAKAKPVPLENDGSLNNCVDFVERTKEVSVPGTDQKEKHITETETKEDK